MDRDFRRFAGRPPGAVASSFVPDRMPIAAPIAIAG